jgi:hypothetical protein
VRQKGGECLAAFWPDAVGVPQQAGHWRYHWTGSRIDIIRELTLSGEGRIYALEY